MIIAVHRTTSVSLRSLDWTSERLPKPINRVFKLLWQTVELGENLVYIKQLSLTLKSIVSDVKCNQVAQEKSSRSHRGKVTQDANCFWR